MAISHFGHRYNRSLFAFVGRLRRRRRTRGAALVELSFSLLILVPLLFGVIQLGIIINATNSVSQISYAVVRYASMHGRDNAPAVDQADQDYTDPNQLSVLYEAYQIAQHTSMIPYGQGSVAGSSNSFAVANANGATITVKYLASDDTTVEGTAAERSLGNRVSVSVTYDMENRIFFPMVCGWMIHNGHAYVTRTSNMLIVQ